MRRIALAVTTVVTTLLTALSGALLLPPAEADLSEHAEQRDRVDDRPRKVMFVGNNWDGTADVVDARTFDVVRRINIVPDREERMREIMTDPQRLAFYLAIQQAVGEGHDQLVDDMFATRDGKLLAVSRPSFGDVVWIDLASGKIVERQVMDGFRTDHMTVSPDRRRLLVSD